MVSTAVGSKIVVRGAAAPLVLRALRVVELDGGWAVPVMGDLAALGNAGIDPGPVKAQFATPDGVICLDAEIVHSAGMFMVRAPGLRPAAITEQRRENVRAAVALTLRATLLATVTDIGSGESRESHEAGGGPREILDGMTRTVSAGGLCVAFAALPAAVRPGVRMYLELTLPGGDLAPAVVSVVGRQPARQGVRIRVRFIDISPLDRERLVRMVFARQRADLAERRNTLR